MVHVDALARALWPLHAITAGLDAQADFALKSLPGTVDLDARAAGRTFSGAPTALQVFLLSNHLRRMRMPDT